MHNLALNIDTITQGGPWVMAISWLGGLLTAFTPCVYPLIPINLGIMGARTSKTKITSFLLSLSFAFGLAVIYSVLGYFVATSGKILGTQSNNIWLVLFVAGIFLAMGISLLGAFEIQVPSKVMTYLAKKEYHGYWGSFLLGAVSGLLAAPCSGPVVVGILAFVAQKSNPLYGFSLLFLFGFGLGFPFIILGTFSQLLTRIPKTGFWTEWIKHLCGLALIAAAFIYLKNILQVKILLSLFLIGAILLILFMKKIFPLPQRFEIFYATLRTVIAVFTVFGFVYAMGSSKNSKKEEHAGIAWVTNLNEGLKLAQEKNKLVMIDVWATWCDACKDLDEKTYSNAEVQKQLNESFISIKVDATDPSIPSVEPFIKKYGITGLPTILFLHKDGKAFSNQAITGFVPPQELLETLSAVRKN